MGTDHGHGRKDAALIDYLAIGVTHLLLVLAMLRLLARGDLDRDRPGPPADAAPPGDMTPITTSPKATHGAGRVGVPRLPRLGGRGRA
ncbi:MAG: hypothetical protein KGJ57_11725 [Sphingomonadales bacterium]|nr:hypothetical protein [Sphingomonadales bacterium]MDE2170084.1 hypothetical protein [Sphingomonadales bacterium]